MIHKHKQFLLCPQFLICAGKIVDSHFVPIPTLRTDNSGIEPRQVGILTSPGKERIPTLRRAIPELHRFLICAEHIY